MELRDIYTSCILWTIHFLFKLYSVFATLVLLAFFPLTKYFVQKRFLSYGIEIGGSKPWDIKVHNDKIFYIRTAIEGMYGLGESRLEGVWSTNDFRELMRRFMLSRRLRQAQHPLLWSLKYFNLQSQFRSWDVGIQHYDAGNEPSYLFINIYYIEVRLMRWSPRIAVVIFCYFHYSYC